MRYQKRLLYNSIFLFAILLFSSLCMSCASTSIYTKTQSSIYEDEVLIGERKSFTKNGGVIDSSSKVYIASEMDGIQIHATVYESSKPQSKTTSITLLQDGKTIDEAEFKSEESKSNESEAYDSAENNYRMQKAYEIVKSERRSNSEIENETGELSLLSSIEEVKVESVPNKPYIVYSFLGKPVVILGCTAWNLLKCAGYACINFMGGYNTAKGDGFLWKMPDVDAAREKSRVAKEANKITAYPEYHVPLTNNRIFVKNMTTETINAFSDNGQEVKVTSSEEIEYDNSISVKRSALADANATAAIIGTVGTIVTIPVSVITWICGAAIGIYDTIANAE